jgi:FKBP-type peptidyl-prolyl cis-trans isomerase FkpA
MKKFLLFACLSILLFPACSKKETGCNPVDPKTEEAQILAYAAKDSIHATKHSSGIYYEIINPGSGVAPTQNSNVSVTYTGKLLNETTFDQQLNPVSFNLNQVIEGWQIGIPLIKKGGRIKLIIPSAYGYGCNATGPIPGNSVLYFDVSLLDVQ